MRRSGALQRAGGNPIRQLAGFFFVEVPSLDEAIVWAKRCPSSKFGSIESRPVLDLQAGWKG
jgi:hypothetical protein